MNIYMQDEYGIDWSGPSGVDHDSVIIPNTTSPLSPTQLDLLRRTINPMKECSDYICTQQQKPLCPSFRIHAQIEIVCDSDLKSVTLMPHR